MPRPAAAEPSAPGDARRAADTQALPTPPPRPLTPATCRVHGPGLGESRRIQRNVLPILRASHAASLVPKPVCSTNNPKRVRVRSKRWSHIICWPRRLLWCQSRVVPRPQMATSVKPERASDTEETIVSKRNRSPDGAPGYPWLCIAPILSVFWEFFASSL